MAFSRLGPLTGLRGYRTLRGVSVQTALSDLGPAVLNTAVMLTKVGLGESPPSGRTKCHAVAPEQSLAALTVLALPGRVMVLAEAATVPTATEKAAATMATPPAITSKRLTNLLSVCSTCFELSFAEASPGTYEEAGDSGPD